MTSSTPTPTRGVPITLDRPRRVRYPLGILRKMQDEMGAAFMGAMQVEKITKILWYGLIHEDPNLTEEQVDNMVDLENLSEVTAAVAKATGQRIQEGDPPTAPADLSQTQNTPPSSAGSSNGS